MRCFIVIALVTALSILGCSSGTDMPSTPDAISFPTGVSTDRSHALWGLWQGVIDPMAGTIEFTSLRDAGFHLNVLPFLEPPPLVHLTLDSLEFNGDIIEADIGLRHPFLGLTEFTGFDVCGIFITNGSVSGFSDADLMMAGEGDTRLLNPDGYSRWWNPAEFPSDGTIFGYNDGLLGTPDSHADYNSTLNGYKYFCTDLEPDDPLTAVLQENRGMFVPGEKNVRHYTLQLGDEGLVFNYAIDANWEFPQGDMPWDAPDDFLPSANRAEAWNISVDEVVNTLWNDGTSSGGNLNLLVDVYDWVNAELNTVYVESPGNFDAVGSVGPIGGGEGYTTYEIDISDATPQSSVSIDLLITVGCEEDGYGGLLPGKTQAAYFIYTASVTGNNCGNFSVTGAIPASAESGTDYDGFTVEGINFQDGLNLAVDIVDGTDVLASAGNVDWVDSETLTCDLDFCVVPPGNYDLRVTNGCEPVSYGYLSYDVTPDPLKNMDLRPGFQIRDLGVRETTGEAYIIFSDGQLWIYNEDYSSGDYKITNTSLDLIDVQNQGEATMGRTTDSGQYIYVRDTNSFFIAGYYGNMMDVTTIANTRHYYWQDCGTYILSTRRSISSHGGNLIPFNFVGSGPGVVNISAFVAFDTSRNLAENDTAWFYALEGAPEYQVERYNYHGSGPTHSFSFSSTHLGGTQGDGQDQVYDPKDVSCDIDSNVYILDQYSTGQPVVKVYDSDMNYLCEFGNSTSISGTPLRLDVDEGDGDVHVAHTNGVSVFRICEIPF